MNIIIIIWEYITESLRYTFIPDNLFTSITLSSYIFYIIMWIIYFRDKLKVNIALTSICLLAGFALKDMLEYLIFFFIDYEMEVFLIDLILKLNEYIFIAAMFMLFKFMIRDGWHKALMVYLISLTNYVLVDKTTWFVDAGLAALGVDDLHYLPDTLIFAAGLAVFGAVTYRFLKPRLVRVFAADIKWLWMGIAAFFIVFDYGWNIFISIYYRRNDYFVDPLDPVFLFVVVQLVIMFVILFILLMLILDNIYKNTRLEAEGVLKDRLLQIKQEQYKRLMENAEEEKAAQHNLRHQLAVLLGFDAAGDYEGLSHYLKDLKGSLPAQEILYCENYTINAIVNYYLSSPEVKHITDIKIDIPENVGSISDMDLCVIMGNLLENAIEAINRMDKGEKFIRVRSLIQGEYLTLSVENSFSGKWEKKNGTYLSYKHESGAETPREGIGLSSVKAVCDKYNGRIVISADGNVWHAAAVLHTCSS